MNSILKPRQTQKVNHLGFHLSTFLNEKEQTTSQDVIFKKSLSTQVEKSHREDLKTRNLPLNPITLELYKELMS